MKFLGKNNFNFIKKTGATQRVNPVTSKKISILNFFCAVMVVFIHSTGYKYFDLSTANIFSGGARILIDYFKSAITKGSVSMFFALSGFLFFSGIDVYDKTKRLKTFKRKLISRVKSLLIPYLVWNVIWMLFRVFVTYTPIIADNIESLEMFEPSVRNVLSGIFLFKYNGVCWYLFYLMLYELLSPLLFYILNSKFSTLILIVASFWISGITFHNSWLGYISHFNSLFFYCLGALLALYGAEFVDRRYTKKTIFLAGFIFLFVTLVFNFIYVNEYIDELLRIAYVGSFWIFAECFIQLRIYWWMEISFFIYLFHGFPQQCINKIFSFLLPNTGNLAPLSAIVNTMGGVAITIFLGIFIAFILIKINRPLWLLLSGFRIPKSRSFESIEKKLVN